MKRWAAVRFKSDLHAELANANPQEAPGLSHKLHMATLHALQKCTQVIDFATTAIQCHVVSGLTVKQRT